MEQDNPIKTEEKPIRDPKTGLFLEGNPGGPGRPAGQSLKEYWKQRFANMSEEEKDNFSKTVAPELLWRMAEGNPQTNTDLTSGGEKIEFNVNLTEGGNDYNSTQQAERSDEGQPQV